MGGDVKGLSLRRERKNIVRTLQKAYWKLAVKDSAAAVLGISTSTLNSKIKSFGIKFPSE